MENFTNNLIPREFLYPSAQFKKAMDTMEIHWWYFNVKEGQMVLSPSLIETLGFEYHDFDAASFNPSSYVHAEERERSIESFNRLLNGESPVYEMEYRLRIKGEWVWYYIRGTVIAVGNDKLPLLVGGITMDISSRYNRLLEKAEEGSKFEFIFRNATEPILIISMGNGPGEGILLEVNQAAADLFACEQKDLVGINPYEVLIPELYGQKDSLRNQLLKNGSLRLEVETRDFIGNPKFVEANAHSFTHQGEGLLIAIVKDKTESYQYRKELKASELALKQSERIYRSLIQAAEDRIGLFDSEGNTLVINNAYYEKLGYTRKEFDKLGEKNLVHPDDRILLDDLSGKFLKSGHLSTEYRVRHKKGHYLHMSSKSVYLKDPDLGSEYILSIIRDITDRVDTQKVLVNAKEKAEESDKLKSAFLANMSHEIRTPMNSIVGFANLLSEEELDVATKKEYARRINKNSDQLLALISDIIDLAKIESNQLPIVYSRVFIGNLFVELMSYGEIQLTNHSRTDVKLIYEPDSDNSEIFIESDLVRLTQIMQNLLNNAVKFTSEGEIRIGYKVLDNSMIRLFVKDSGTGIDSKNFEIIFDQFRQIDGSNIRKYGGTGLGLAICKHLSELLKGRIWVESIKDVGSSFFVELPVVSGYAIDGIPLRKRENPSMKAAQITTLLVDDDPDSLTLMSSILRSEGIQVITAETGYRALEILESEMMPDLVLLDLQMPVINGLQTLGIMREKYPAIKVVAQSAQALEGEKEKTISAGFDGYISKPYSKQGLLDIISKAIHQ